MKNLKRTLNAMLVLTMLYFFIAGAVSRIRDPQLSETEHLIRMFYWSYQTETVKSP